MVDVLGISPAITNSLIVRSFQFESNSSGSPVRRIGSGSRCTGFCGILCSDMEKDRRCARIYALDTVSKVSKVGNAWFGGTIPNHMCEPDSLYEVDSTLSDKEKDDAGEISLEPKSPPWGILESQEDLDFQTDGFDPPLQVSKMSGNLDVFKIYYLEERNEEILSNRILKLSRSNKIRSAMELYWSMKYSGLRLGLHACNSLLSCLLRNNMLDDAMKLFEFMKANEIASGHTYSLMLKAVANSSGCDVALEMFNALEAERHLKKDFDIIVYNTMISVCSKANNWIQAERIWRHLKASDCSGTTVTYRLLVCTFVRCGQNELALDAYNEMIQNGLEPGEDAMQAIIGASTREGKWDLALSVFNSMLECGLKPNLIACNALVNSLGKAGKVKIALNIYGLIKSLGHVPDEYTWNALLGALYRSKHHGDSLRLFECIQRGQTSLLNVHTYNTVLMSCQRLALWERALQLLWQMEASGLPVSTASYNLVIGACEAARKPKVALQVYDHMVHRKQTPDTFTLLSLIRGCIWGSLWDEVEEILNRATPCGSLYNAAIQGMCLRGKIVSAKEIYVKMRQIGLNPDGKTRALMLQNLPKRFNLRRARNR